MTATQGPAAAEEESAPPALYEHCKRTYQEMLRQATTVVQPAPAEDLDADDSAGSIVVYEGFLTHLVTQKLNLSVPYYTSIRKNLIRMGCIRQLKRGGGSSPSQWELIYEPTEDAFRTAQPPKVPKQTPNEQALDLIRNLSARVSELEDWRDAVNDSLVQNFGVEPEEGSSE